MDGGEVKKHIKEKFNQIHQWLKEYPLIIFVVFISGFLADIFAVEFESDLRKALVLLIYWLYLRFSASKSQLTFMITLIILIGIAGSFLINGPSALTERMAVWLVLLLAFGIIQQWRELGK